MGGDDPSMVLGSSPAINGKNLGHFLNETLLYKDGQVKVTVASQWWSRNQIQPFDSWSGVPSSHLSPGHWGWGELVCWTSPFWYGVGYEKSSRSLNVYYARDAVLARLLLQFLLSIVLKDR